MASLGLSKDHHIDSCPDARGNQMAGKVRSSLADASLPRELGLWRLHGGHCSHSKLVSMAHSRRIHLSVHRNELSGSFRRHTDQGCNHHHQTPMELHCISVFQTSMEQATKIQGENRANRTTRVPQSNHPAALQGTLGKALPWCSDPTVNHT